MSDKSTIIDPETNLPKQVAARLDVNEAEDLREIVTYLLSSRYPHMTYGGARNNSEGLRWAIRTCAELIRSGKL